MYFMSPFLLMLSKCILYLLNCPVKGEHPRRNERPKNLLQCPTEQSGHHRWSSLSVSENSLRRTLYASLLSLSFIQCFTRTLLFLVSLRSRGFRAYPSSSDTIAIITLLLFTPTGYLISVVELLSNWNNLLCQTICLMLIKYEHQRRDQRQFEV